MDISSISSVKEQKAKGSWRPGGPPRINPLEDEVSAKALDENHVKARAGQDEKDRRTTRLGEEEFDLEQKHELLIQRYKHVKLKEDLKSSTSMFHPDSRSSSPHRPHTSASRANATQTDEKREEVVPVSMLEVDLRIMAQQAQEEMVKLGYPDPDDNELNENLLSKFPPKLNIPTPFEMNGLVDDVLSQAGASLPPHLGFVIDDIQRELVSASRPRNNLENTWGMICRFLRDHLGTLNLLMYRSTQRWTKYCVSAVSNERLGALLAESLLKLTQEYMTVVNRYNSLALSHAEGPDYEDAAAGLYGPVPQDDLISEFPRNIPYLPSFPAFSSTENQQDNNDPVDTKEKSNEVSDAKKAGNFTGLKNKNSNSSNNFRGKTKDKKAGKGRGRGGKRGEKVDPQELKERYDGLTKAQQLRKDIAVDKIYTSYIYIYIYI